jgi:hypothetical protein
MMESALVIDSSRSLDAVRHAFVKTFQAPFREGDPDHRDLKVPSLCHCIECREDHLVGKITGYTEEHQCI